jgi:hypothetical protein
MKQDKPKPTAAKKRVAMKPWEAWAIVDDLSGTAWQVVYASESLAAKVAARSHGRHATRVVVTEANPCA